MVYLFQTGALWGFKGTFLGVNSRKAEWQEGLGLVAGGMQVGVMQLGVMVVGGRARVLRWRLSTWWIALHTSLSFSSTFNCKTKMSCKLNAGWG